MIKVNKVDIKNLDVLSKIDVDNFDDAWTKSMFKTELEHENSEYFGLFNDDEIIGFCGGWLVADEYQINKIVIDKPHRNKKLGQIFFTYVMQFMKLKGVKKALIEVRVSNMPAITVYEKAGFQTIDMRKNYYKNNGENAYIMVRDFSNERY
ncbi:ribosomal-protein-alanine acetyltransferase [Gemella bergeri ATCC 700627]|uniref:[Ribosomal protein bS18]-alanine N-acetyltransferase n=1 Tax=Gemella bergeri ATCC 700627 TaxID=1321820 RepID=U2S4I9_9BACL|nr:ribosomal protein S18-alanine N-acetyltransferase [Gemella bergeri]ERK60613.1 ribosomal-protein-alanine acetyltransferase [Gemella bergeri ATCC 700627]